MKVRSIFVFLCFATIVVGNAQVEHSFKNTEVIPDLSFFDGLGIKINFDVTGRGDPDAVDIINGKKPLVRDRFPYSIEYQLQVPDRATFNIRFAESPKQARTTYDFARRHNLNPIPNKTVGKPIKKGEFEYVFVTDKMGNAEHQRIEVLIGNVHYSFFTHLPNGKDWLMKSAIAYKDYLLNKTPQPKHEAMKLRIWTSSDGVKIEGKVRSYDPAKKTLVLETKAGRVFKDMPISRFSEADQKLIQEISAAPEA